MTTFDVLLPVYINDGAAEVAAALRSVVDQTELPARIVVVCDGPVATDVDSFLTSFASTSAVPVVIDRGQINEGLGRALARGVKRCTSQYIARMDADDVSVPGRFQAQMKYLSRNPNIDVLGGHIREFDSRLGIHESSRVVPLSHGAISRKMNVRNPVNHVTVMVRRSELQNAGGYLHCPFYEDYYLWLRMKMKGATFANLDEYLAEVRGGTEMVSRRGGMRYGRATLSFLRQAAEGRLLPYRYIVLQFVLRSASALLSHPLRGFLYRRFLRK